MRSFGSLAPRQLRARPLRALLTAAGIVLGVGMVFGVLLLSATVFSTFEDLYDSAYGRTDLVVSGEGSTGSLAPATLKKVRQTEGVAEVSPNVFSTFTLIDERGRARKGQGAQLNVIGVDPEAENLNDARVVAGRDIERGREIQIEESWAKGRRIEPGDRIRVATPAGARALRVAGLFQFSTGLQFGGQGFAAMPIAEARRLMDKPRVYDEINVAVDGGQGAIDDVRGRLRKELGSGVSVETPKSKGEEIQSQLRGFSVVIYFFAAMALFVGGFLIFNSFNMTVLQRLREIGMLRTLGATRRMIAGSVLREALVLGVVGTALGLALGIGLAVALVWIMRQLDFPVGQLTFSPLALIAAIVTGLATTALAALVPARRAGRISPIRAILGAGEARTRPSPRRVALGVPLIGLGLAGVYLLAKWDDTPTWIAAAGMGGVIALFLGLSLIAPVAIVPLTRVLAWPLRRLSPVEGRLAADSAGSNPVRTAATTSGLMIALALVVAFGSLGSSFLESISAEFDRSFARDLTVQPRGLNPGAGPQQTIAAGLRRRVARLPEAKVVARERFFYVPDLPGGRKKADGLLVAFDPDDYREVDTSRVLGVDREELFERIKRGQVSVGKGYADEADLEVGDPILLDGPSGRVRTRVAGIVKTVIFGGQTVGMSIQRMREVYGITADSELAIEATSAGARPALERKLERVVERDYPNLVVLSNDELKSKIESHVNQQFGFFYAILAAAIVVSLLGIVNTLSMSVIERIREIGVLRALGSSRWQVGRTVVHESVLIGLIGAGMGIVAGLGLGWVFVTGLAAGVPGVAYQAPAATIAAVAVLGGALGVIAAVLPARRAARLDVIQALSYE